jgi:hypothetical protein
MTDSPTDGRRPRDEWKVVACVCAALVACELGFRAFENRLSADLVHYAEAPAIVDGLARAEGRRVLFLGNSLTRRGVDDERMGRALSAAGPVAMAKVHPDDTSVVEWRRLVERFAAGGRPPMDALVVSYAQTQLSDDTIVRPRRLGRHYAGADNLWGLLTEEARRFDVGAELLLAYASSSFANAERVQTRVLDLVVPGYRDAAQRINAAPAAGGSAAKAQARPARTYERLGHLLDAASGAGVPVALVAVPLPSAQPNAVDPALVRLAADRGVAHLDATATPGVTDGDFPDGYHLGEEGSRRFTDHVGPQIAEWLASGEE